MSRIPVPARSAETTHYRRLYSWRNYTEALQDLQREDSRVVDRLHHQKQITNKLRRFLATAESRDWDYNAAFQEDDADLALPQDAFGHSPRQSQELEQYIYSSTSALSPDYGTAVTPRIRGGNSSATANTGTERHSRKKYQKHHYSLKRQQKKVRTSEELEEAFILQLCQIHRRTKLYRDAWRSEQDRVCGPFHDQASHSQYVRTSHSQHEHQHNMSRRDSGASGFHHNTSTLVQLAKGATEAAAMYGQPLSQSWQELLAHTIGHGLYSMGTRDHADLNDAADDDSEPYTELRESDLELARIGHAAEETAKRQTAADPVQTRYDEVIASNRRSRRRLNRSYSTDDLEDVRRYNERQGSDCD